MKSRIAVMLTMVMAATAFGVIVADQPNWPAWDDGRRALANGTDDEPMPSGAT